MKAMEVTQKTIDDYTYYIRPIPAFPAAGLSAELLNFLSPIVGGLVPIIGSVVGSGIGDKIAQSNDGSKKDGSTLTDEELLEIMGNIDIESIMPSIQTALDGLDGNRTEALMRKLLITYGNVYVEGEATDGNSKQLDNGLANAVFCGDVQNMYVLCFYVIQVSFKGFFKKLLNRFGLLEKIPQQIKTSKNTEISMSQPSQE